MQGKDQNSPRIYLDRRRMYQGVVPSSLTNYSPIRLPIPRGLNIHKFAIRVKMVLNITVAGTIALAKEFPYNCLQSIRLLTNGDVPLIDLQGVDVNDIIYGYKGRNIAQNVDSTLTVASHNVEVHFPLYMVMPGAKRPTDTLLRSNNYDTLDIVLTPGLITDMYVLGTGAATVTSWTADIMALEDSAINNGVNTGDFIYHRYAKPIIANTLGVNAPLDLDRNNATLRRLHMVAIKGGVYSDALIDNIYLKTGIFPFVTNMPWTQVQAENEELNLLANGTLGIRVGKAFFDASPAGDVLKKGIDTSGYQDFKLQCDFTPSGANDYLRLLIEEVKPRQ